MFRLPRPKSGRSASGERFSFHFSDFQALQVPEKWDRLSVSLVSMRMGKAVTKLGKATVNDGSCEWTETLTQSIVISQDDEESLLKFVVAMGSTKAGTLLGEANVNIARYINSNDTVPLSLPLAKCDHGTVLQLNIQCQTPRTDSREDQKMDKNSFGDYPIEHDEMEEESDNAFSSNIGSSTTNHMEQTNENKELLRTKFFTVSFASVEGSSGKHIFSPQHNSTESADNQIRRLDSAESEDNTPTQSLSSIEDCVRSNNAFDSESQCSSKDFMETSQETLKKELPKQLIKDEISEMKLSASQAECKRLKREISELKLLLEETRMNNKDVGETKPQNGDVDNIKKELENEMRFLKESNVDLADQLQKTQDSNAELLSILQELETIVETQKVDIVQLSSEKLKLEENLGNNIHILEEKLDKDHGLNDQALMDCESKWRSMLAEKDEEIAILEEQIAQCLEDQGGHDSESDFPQETEFLRTKLEELERECTELVEENMQLVFKLKEAKNSSTDLKETVMLEDGSSQQLDDRLNEILALTNSLESLEAAYKEYERKSSELENGKEDLAIHLSKMEKENIQLSEQLSDLEARKRLITYEKDAYHQKLKNSNRDVKKLRNEITRLEGELEAQKVDAKQKLHDMQKRWLEAQEECEYLTKVNPKLQATASNLMDECNSLQKTNADLKTRNKELHKYRVVLEARVNDAEKKLSKCGSTVEGLESEFSTMLEVMALKEESIRSQLETLAHENKNLNEKIIAEQKMLNEMYVGKCLEVENLQKELVHLLEQISALYNGKAEFPSEAIVELCFLRAEKSKLEISIEELREKLGLSERKLSARQLEAEAKVVELMSELTSSKQKHDICMVDIKKLKVKLQNARSRKKKCKSSTRELETKFKVSEHEKMHLEEEISVLKTQQQKASQLQDEVISFKNSLNEAKFELKRLQTAYDSLSGDHKKLVSERVLLDQKVRGNDKDLSELEEYRCRTAILEAKISRLEEDLNAREQLYAQDAEMKIELGKIERANNELLRKINYLEEDREEYLKKIKASDGQSEGVMDDYLARIQSLENELSKALEAKEMYQSQLSRFLSDEQNSSKSSAKQNGANAKVADSLVWNLQSELKDIRERYFQMSLRYAEVEAQREELVMKLKSKNNKKGWFS
ncbi:hypothetical protein V2J09_001441 [Rumex salicifolius]